MLPKEYLPFAEQFGRGRTAGSAPGGAASLDALSRLLLSVDGASAATSPAAPAPPGDPNLWIMKPVGLSRGRGISLISDISQVRLRSSHALEAQPTHCRRSPVPGPVCGEHNHSKIHSQPSASGRLQVRPPPVCPRYELPTRRGVSLPARLCATVVPTIQH